MISRGGIGAVARPSRGGSGESDASLMSRVRTGDTIAFARLYNRHAIRALRVAQAVCHDAASAEEAVQEGFLAIWRRRASFDPREGTFQAWLMRMVQNRAIDSLRGASARLRREQMEALDPDGPRRVAPSTQDEAIARWERAALRSSLRRLPAPQAEVIALAYFGGLNQAEIAAQLKVPTSTVKGRMRLGLEKLRQEVAVTGLTMDPDRAGELQTATPSRGRSREAWLEKRMAPSSIGP